MLFIHHMLFPLVKLSEIKFYFRYLYLSVFLLNQFPFFSPHILSSRYLRHNESSLQPPKLLNITTPIS